MNFNQIFYKLIYSIILLFSISTCFADTLTVKVFSTKDSKELGTVTFKDIEHGLLITPELSGLPPGSRGFHFHAHPDCGDHGMKAGDHFDPEKTNTHLGPYGKGHLGDLPVLIVESDGTATVPVLAPRLKTKDLKDLALMIHEGSDTYSDIPELGGGGGRIACGKL